MIHTEFGRPAALGRANLVLAPALGPSQTEQTAVLLGRNDHVTSCPFSVTDPGHPARDPHQDLSH